MLDIYPARELPIEGVSSATIFEQMRNPHKRLVNKANLLEVLAEMQPEVLLTMGAGDIDTFTGKIGEVMSEFEDSKI